MQVGISILDFLQMLAEQTSRELWKIARQQTTESRLVLPRYRNGKHRVSEQEARSISQRLVSKSDYFFSIETPTVGVHNFTGKVGGGGRSAQHDMSLYTSADPASVVAHAEFKQGHKSDEDGVNVIAKDLIKLIDSGIHSLWFHSFPKPTRNEFVKLQGFFSKALEKATPGRELVSNARVVPRFLRGCRSGCMDRWACFVAGGSRSDQRFPEYR